MINIDKNTRRELINLYKNRKISLEGNILKLIECEDDKEFKAYIEEAINNDKKTRRKRLDVNKRVQIQNTELTSLDKENNRVNRQLTKALEEAEQSKLKALEAKSDAERLKDEAEVSRDKANQARIEADKARAEAENAKSVAEGDLELMQKKKQFELIGTIVRAALWVILGVGVVTTTLYIMALYSGVDTTVIGSTWSNIIGILLTNSFSIVGTIMGVKYASNKKDSDD